MDSEPPVSGRREISVTPVTGTVADYAGLKGGTGRDIYFRPDRYQRAELGPIGIAVELTLEDERQRCELVDVSQNGVAFVWPLGTSVEVGTILEEIVVRFDDHEAFRGEARVSSVRHEDERLIVGASLVDTLMNIEDVLHLRDVKAWAGSGENPGLGLKKAAWRTPGQERFKALVADMRLLLEDGRQELGELEAVLPWHVTHGDADTPARDALIERVRGEFSAEVVQLSNEIDAALRLATRAERDALNEYSNRLLHPLLMQSPWMHRARHKPLGYAGDYELMNGLYGNHFSGATLFAKAVNLAFVSTPAAVAVRTRKELMKRKLSEALDGGKKSVRILSIAAGPAQEVYELLQERHELPESVEIVLYDQDKRALTFSYGRLKRLVDSKWKGQVKLLHLNDSIRHLLRDTAVFAGHGAFDLVYSVGLFDYLQMLTAVSLCRNLFSLVAPGGTLLVGNMVPSNPCRWFMELHLDWFLVYRERSEMLELSRLAAPNARVEILDEPTRVNPFVALTKE